MSTAETQPAFTTAVACRQWLKDTPLGNAIQALSQILRQLNMLNRMTIDSQERLAILELLRKRLVQAQEESAKRFIGKSLPLVPPEHAAYDSVQAVWQALLRGYGSCIEADINKTPPDNARVALLFQRAFATLAALHVDIYRAGFEPSTEHWLALHRLYALAEQSGIADTEVEDVLRHGKAPTSPRAAYVEIHLVHLASPHELSSRNLAWVLRWARRWAHKVLVLTKAPAADSESAVLTIDLSAGQPACYGPLDKGELRWLDTSQLRRSLKKRISQLEKGATPADLQLGEDCTQPTCGQVLKQVYQRWCRGGIARRHERHLTEATCALVSGVEAIYYQLAGRKPFRQPGLADDDALRRERDELATFDRIAPASLGALASPSTHDAEEWAVVEEWQMRDESATGLHAVHRLDGNLDRVNRRQLVAVMPPEAKAYLIGSIRWGMVNESNELHVGILLLPGRPVTLAVRPIEPSGVREPYKPGFLMPDMPSIGATSSLILAPGTFRAGRIMELIGEQRRNVRLLRLLDRGIDFDRVSFEPVE